MTTIPPQSSAVAKVGESRWAAFAGLMLLVLGLPITVFGVVLMAQGLAYDDRGNMGYGTLALVIGAVLVVIAIVHITVGTFIWRHHPWARYAGIVVGLLGAMLAAIVLLTAFNPVYQSGLQGELIQVGPNVMSIVIGLSFFPYVFAVIGLVLGGDHFRRRRE